MLENIPLFEPRKRKRPDQQKVLHADLYGEFADNVRCDEKFRNDLRDRAAHLYVTGLFPSHLRKTYSAALKQVSRPYKKPTSLDGRSGGVLMYEDVVRHLELEKHPMVRAVREHMQRGYLVTQPNEARALKPVGRGNTTENRRNFGKVRMHRLNSEGGIRERVSIYGNGSVLDRWD
jgi:hypothetical protein